MPPASPDTSFLSFSGTSARVQYLLLMGLYHLAFTRALYGRFARGLGRLFPASNWAALHTPDAAPFRIRLNDGYWTRFVLYHHSYEPEIGRVLQAATGKTPLFADLGANTGYWTTRAAPHFKAVIAVEAASSTFAQLRANTEALSNVTRHHAAIFERSGEALSFVNVHNSHASARLAQGDPAGAQDSLETVITHSIDALVPAGIAALIKLDVEGAEIAAFRGAARSLEDGAVVLYEDHGNDPDCAPTAWLLEQPGMAVFAIGEDLSPIATVAVARALKTDHYRGYNFLAARRESPLLQEICRVLPVTARD